MGGSNDKENIVLACDWCNRLRYTINYREFTKILSEILPYIKEKKMEVASSQYSPATRDL